MEKLHRCNDEQRDILITFMEGHPELVFGKMTPPLTLKMARALWENAARLINAAPGPSKDGEGWKSTWRRMKRTARDQQNKANALARARGDGPPRKKILSVSQERVLALVGRTAMAMGALEAQAQGQGQGLRTGPVRGEPPVLAAESDLGDPEQDPLDDDWHDLCGLDELLVKRPPPVLRSPAPSHDSDVSAPAKPVAESAHAPAPTVPPVAARSVARRPLDRNWSAQSRLRRAAAAAEKFQSVEEEMLELRRSELDMLARQNEIANRHAEKRLALEVERQKALDGQNAVANRLAEQQIAVHQRLVDVLKKLADK